MQAFSYATGDPPLVKVGNIASVQSMDNWIHLDFQSAPRGR